MPADDPDGIEGSYNPAARPGGTDLIRQHFLARLGGDCDLPAGAHATVADDDTITLTGVLLDAGDTTMRRFASVGQAPDELGTLVAERLLSGTGT